MKVKPLVKDFISPEYKTESAGGMDIYFQEDVTLVAGKDNILQIDDAAL